MNEKDKEKEQKEKEQLDEEAARFWQEMKYADEKQASDR